MSDTSYSLFSQLLHQLSYGQTFSLCIHDVTGIVHETPELHPAQNNTRHCSAFCSKAKLSYKGYKQCLRCKQLTIQQAKEKKTAFVGQCYLGLTEIVYPIHFDGQLQCILYLSNLYDTTNSESFKKRILRNAPLIDIDPKELFSLISTLETYHPKNYSSYMDTLSFLEAFIRFTYDQKPKITHSKSTGQSPPIYRGNIHPAIRQASDYISLHYCELITLDTLSNLCYLHPDYFSKLFKKETGVSVTHYIQSIRIERAKELLHYTDDKIIDVSMTVGFNNPSYFCRLFKRLTGISASLYRNQKQHHYTP